MKNIAISISLALAILALTLILLARGCGWFGINTGPEVISEPDYDQFLEEPSPVPEPIPEPDPIVPDTSEEEPEPEPEPVKPAIDVWPVWMYIPALGVDAEIQDTDTDYVADTMEIVPSADVISWWRESVIPGNDGNAIFGGHNKWRGARGQLLELDTLEIGDEMEIVYEDGTTMKFRLESVFVYLLATAPGGLIMDIEGDARVTLITCKEPFNPVTGTSDNRIIAIFKPAEGFVIPDPPIEPFPLKEGEADGPN